MRRNEHPLHAIRRRRGLSQAAVGELAGCSQQTVARIEAGGRLGQGRAAAAVARALDLRVQDVVENGQLELEEAVAIWLGLDADDPSTSTYLDQLQKRAPRPAEVIR